MLLGGKTEKGTAIAIRGRFAIMELGLISVVKNN